LIWRYNYLRYKRYNGKYYKQIHIFQTRTPEKRHGCKTPNVRIKHKEEFRVVSKIESASYSNYAIAFARTFEHTLH
jgi:hypothetical protein